MWQVFAWVGLFLAPVANGLDYDSGAQSMGHTDPLVTYGKLLHSNGTGRDSEKRKKLEDIEKKLLLAEVKLEMFKAGHHVATQRLGISKKGQILLHFLFLDRSPRVIGNLSEDELTRLNQEISMISDSAIDLGAREEVSITRTYRVWKEGDSRPIVIGRTINDSRHYQKESRAELVIHFLNEQMTEVIKPLKDRAIESQRRHHR